MALRSSTLAASDKINQEQGLPLNKSCLSDKL